MSDMAESGAGAVRDEYGRISRIRLSAKTGEGLEFIRQALAEAVSKGPESLNETSMESMDFDKIRRNSATV